MKTLIDRLLAAAGLAASSPILAASVLALKSETRGPALFVQERVGLHGRTFSIYKLRTMAVGHGGDGQTFDHSPGVTRVGRLLRRSKLDEVPQLWNVIRGDMSLVGPRPCLPETLGEMPDWAFARFAVRPGLTGLAQVNGNASIPWLSRWRYDVAYVRSVSLVTDMRILTRTITAVLVREKPIANREAHT